MNIGIRGLDNLTNRNKLKKCTLGQSLSIWAEEYGESIAIVDNTEITYREFDMYVTKLANIFIEHGINKSDRIIVQLPNGAFCIITCFALFRIGAVPILAIPGLRQKEIQNIVEFAVPEAYITTDTYLGFNYEKMANIIGKQNSFKKGIFIDRDLEYELKLRDKDEQIIEHRQVEIDETALLILSGGTTRIPKLIPLKHSDLNTHLRLSAERCELGRNTVFLAVLSLAHKLALHSPGILGTFYVGGKVVIANNENCEDVFTLINKEKVTITSTVPSLAKMWLETIENEENVDISSLEKVICAGEILHSNTAREIMEKLDCDLIQLYGMSEGVCFTTLLNDSVDVKCSCQGKTISLKDEFRIIDEKGNDVENGLSGELVFKGPYRFDGYFNMLEENKHIFTADGFFHTGDKARLSSDGNIIIEGRIREQINVAGEKVMPAEIEGYLREIDGVKDAAVVGIEDDLCGQRIYAFVVPQSQKIDKILVYKQLEKMNIAKFKYPSQIEIIDSLPHTNVGKVDKKVLKALISSK
ncbi:AMP-binding protein [Haloimpatiens sp. FM7330]|uniref:AMP-binding protein n=1 Tax=Haloimpatiens sp. FM7330 TaxID=3298610 RepID=UPI00363F7A1F